MGLGLGLGTVLALGKSVSGLRELPRFEGERVPTPSTPGALWLWLRGDDPGELLHHDRELMQTLAPAFTRQKVQDAFNFRHGHDLTGYEDGTENPSAQNAPGVALARTARASSPCSAGPIPSMS